MSLQQFLSQRQESIQKSQAIDIRARDAFTLSIRNFLNKAEAMEVYVTCDSCVNFQTSTGTDRCIIDLANIVDVPPEIQIFGCGKGVVDDIPF